MDVVTGDSDDVSAKGETYLKGGIEPIKEILYEDGGLNMYLSPIHYIPSNYTIT